MSALTIEDTLLPVPFGGDDAQLIPIAEGVGKMRAEIPSYTDAGWMQRPPAIIVRSRSRRSVQFIVPCPA